MLRFLSCLIISTAFSMAIVANPTSERDINEARPQVQGKDESRAELDRYYPEVDDYAPADIARLKAKNRTKASESLWRRLVDMHRPKAVLPVMCPHPDYDGLMALYNATGGPDWTDNTGWVDGAAGTDCEPCEWYGIECDGDGRVTCIDMDGNSNCNSRTTVGNNLIGNVPVELGQLGNLISIDLSSNFLSGTIPSELGQLWDLESLSLGENVLTGVIPSDLWQLENLTTLDLSGNSLTGSIFPALGQLENLVNLDLSRNNLTGSISFEIGQLERLSNINISNNSLSGSLPLELVQLENLRFLILSENNLGSGIPSELGQLVNLRRLDLSNNFLSGSLPLEIGQLANLEFLILSGNSLNGSLPPDLGQLESLRRLDLSNNTFSGNVPPQLGQLSEISDFLLHNNQFSGCFPEEILPICAGLAPADTSRSFPRGYSFLGNPLLPYEGDYERICNGEPQIGGPCNDSNPTTENDQIQPDCTCAGELPATCPTGTTVTVTNTNDDGPGSLREAINCANTDPTLDLIRFDAGLGAATISLSSALPPITDDGIDISALNGTITIDGSSVSGAGARGLSVSGNNFLASNLHIDNFPSDGFYLDGTSGADLQFCGASNNGRIDSEGNGIEADGAAFGVTIISCEIDGNRSGIFLNSVIGFTVLSNNISGNITGLEIVNGVMGAIDGNVVQNSTGLSAIVLDGGNNIEVGTTIGNSIYNNIATGLQLRQVGSNITIQNNQVGSNGFGQDFGNSGPGIFLSGSPIGVRIEQNIIGFNVSRGIWVGDGSDEVLVSQNNLFCNDSGGIELSGNANQNFAPPTLTLAATNRVEGNATGQPFGTVEIYRVNNDDCGGNTVCQGSEYLGTVNAAGGIPESDFFSFTPEPPLNIGDRITVLTIDQDGTRSSEFSNCLTVSGSCPEAFPADPIVGCGDPVTYDLTTAEADIIGGQTGVTVSWYASGFSTDLITDPSNYSPDPFAFAWFAEVSDGVCASFQDVTLIGGTGPQATNPNLPSEVCAGENITVTVNISGGTPPYTGDFFISPTEVETFTNFAGGDYTFSFTLPEGDYTYFNASFPTVQDANGCFNNAVGSGTLFVTASPTITAPATAPICLNGFDNLVNLTQYDNDLGGGAQVQWFEDQGAGQVITDPTAYLFEVSGSIDLYVIVGGGGCGGETTAVNFTVTDLPTVTATPPLDLSGTFCQGDELTTTLTFSGGRPPFSGDITTSAGVLASWSNTNGPVNITITFDDTGDFDYTATPFFVADANGCPGAATTSNQISYSVVAPPTLSCSPVTATAGQNDGAITVEVSGGQGPFSYSVLPGGLTGNFSGGMATVEGLGAGTYEVMVTDLGSGCVETCMQTVVESGGGCGDVNLVVLGSVDVVLNEDCQVQLTVDDVLNGDFGCTTSADFEVTVIDRNTSNGSIVDSVGSFNFRVDCILQDCTGFTSAWGTVNATGSSSCEPVVGGGSEINVVNTPQDNVFLCTRYDEYTIADAATYSKCFLVESGSGEIVPGSVSGELAERLNLGTGNAIVPTFTGNCSSQIQVCVADVPVFGEDAPCDPIVVTRSFTSTADDCTSTSVIVQYNFRRPSLNELIGPDAIVNFPECGVTNPVRADYPAPRPEDYPSIISLGDTLRLVSGEAICNIGISFTDGDAIVTCPYSYRFVRTYTVIDWCAPAEIETFTQIVRVGENLMPSFTGPSQDRDDDGVPDIGPLVYPTNVDNSCEVFIRLDDPTISLAGPCGGEVSLNASIYLESGQGEIGPFELNLADGQPELTSEIPLGNHVLRYRYEDVCGNGDSTDFDIEVVYFPTPVCIQSLTVVLMSDGEGGGTAATYSSDLLAASIEDCEGNPIIEYSIHRETAAASDGFTPDPASDQVDFFCSDIGSVIVRMYAYDEGSGLTGFCSLPVEVQDNFGLCAPPTCIDGIQNGNETGIDCGGPDCAGCPVNTDLSVDLTDTQGEVGEIVCLDLVGADFVEINSFQFSITFDESVIAYESSMASVNGNNVSMVNAPSNVVRVSYAPFSNTGYTDEGPFIIGEVCFTILQEVETEVLIVGSPIPVEFSDTDNNLYEIGDVIVDGGVINSGSTGGGPTCSDGIQNGNETGVDCGGPDCAPCSTQNECGASSSDLNICAGTYCDVAISDQICVDITANNFTDVTGLQFDVLFPADNLDYNSATSNPLFTTNMQFNGATDGRVRVLFFDPTGEGVTIGSDETLVTICFTNETLAPTLLDVANLTVATTDGNVAGVTNDGSINSCGNCTDGVQNGDETGIDCGGPDCGPCPELEYTAEDVAVFGTETMGSIGEEVCVYFVADTLPEIVGIQFSVNYPTERLQFSRASGQLGDTDGSAINSDPGIIRYVASLFSSEGYSALNDTLVEICFLVADTSRADILITNTPTPIDFTDENLNQIPAGVLTPAVINPQNFVTCSDGIQNGNEAGVDCGGPDCSPCQTADCFPASDNLGFCLTEICNVGIGERTCLDLQASNFTDLTAFQIDVLYPENQLTFQDFTSAFGLGSDLSFDISTPNRLRLLWFQGTQTGLTYPDGRTLVTICFANESNDRSTLVLDNIQAVDIIGNISGIDAGQGSVNICGTCEDGLLNQDEITVDCGGSCDGCLDPPDNLTLILGDGEGVVGTEVCVDLTANSFTELDILSFSMNYDPGTLIYSRTTNFGLNSISSANVSSPEAGVIVFDWMSSDPNGETLAEGGRVLSFCFTIDRFIETRVDFANSPALILSRNANNQPVGVVPRGGTVNGGAGVYDGLTLVVSNEVANEGTQVCLDVDVFNLEDLAGLQFGVNYDNTKLEFVSGTETGQLPDLQVGALEEGSFRVVWFDPNVGSNDVPNGESIVTICFNVLQACATEVLITEQAPQFRIRATNSGNEDIPINVVGGSVNATIPVCTEQLTFEIGTADAVVGEQVCLPIRVYKAIDLVSFQYSMVYDPAVLNYVGSNPPFPLNEFSVTNINHNQPGLFRTIWADPLANPNTLVDGEVIYNLCFEVLSSSPTVIYFEDRPTVIEFEDVNGVVEVDLINGAVNGSNTPTIGLTEITPPSCQDGDDGSISLTVSGSNLGYEWSPNVSSGATATGLEDGTYNLTITNQDNGQFITESFTLNDPGPFSVEVGSVESVSCFGADDGSINLNIIGDTGPYLIDWSGSLTDNVNQQDNLASGSYSVSVTDANGCVRISNNIRVGEPGILGVTGTTTEINDQTPGSVDAVVSGGRIPYSYSWTGPGAYTFSEEDPNDIVDPGTYCLTVTDTNECEDVQCFAINRALSIVAVDATSNCGNGDCSIDITVVGGGTGNYSYEWTFNGAVVSNNQDLATCEPGDYILVVTSGASTITDTITISPETNIVATSVIVSDTEDAGCTGMIELDISGGTEPYEVSWNLGGNIITGGPTISLLCAGSYSFTITDAVGCSQELSPISISRIDEGVESITEVNCEDGESGAVDVAISGGVAPYTFEWRVAGGAEVIAATEDLSGVPAGDYVLTITDATGASLTKSYTITIGAGFSVLLDVISDYNGFGVSCPGANDGIIQITASTNSSLTYEFVYEETVVGVGELLEEAIAGTYSVTARDEGGCELTQIVEITAPPVLLIEASIDGGGCNENDEGSIMLTVQGGIEPYEYSWSTESNQSEINALGAGRYTVTVTDRNECSVEQSFEISASYTTTIDTTLCPSDFLEVGGITYDASNPSGSQELQTVDNCDSTIVVQLAFYDELQTETIPFNLCAGDTLRYAGEVIATEGGIYERFVASQLGGCDSLQLIWDVTVVEVATITDKDTTCLGVPVLWRGEFLSNPGTYQFTETTVDGSCDTLFELELTVIDPTDMVLRDDAFDLLRSDEFLELDLLQNDTLPYDYELIFPEQPERGILEVEESRLRYFPDAVYVGPDSFRYEVCLRECPGFCFEAWVRLNIDFNCILEFSLDIPNGFTPNNDGKNDFFDPRATITGDCLDQLGEMSLTIRNIQSEIIFETTGGVYQAWDGTDKKGRPQPVGTYWYIFGAEDLEEPVTGAVELVR